MLFSREKAIFLSKKRLYTEGSPFDNKNVFGVLKVVKKSIFKTEKNYFMRFWVSNSPIIRRLFLQKTFTGKRFTL
jgi:hypothetical protein